MPMSMPMPMDGLHPLGMGYRNRTGTEGSTEGSLGEQVDCLAQAPGYRLIACAVNCRMSGAFRQNLYFCWQYA